MRDKIVQHGMAACLSLVTILGVGAGWTPCYGQANQLLNAQTGTDTYGNARSIYNVRRAVGNFANDTQRSRLRGFQSDGRRALFRGGNTPFAFPSDRVLANLAGRPLTAPRSSADTWQNRQAFTQFGVLGTKRPVQAPTDPANLFGRRAALLRATSGLAPVRQALILRGSTLPPVGPGLPQTATFSRGDSSPLPVTLGDAMQMQLTETAVSMKARGWAYFEDGEYRRAVRAFESAAMLAPEDFEPRIAEIFCSMSVGAFHTAAVSLERLARQNDTLFTDSVDVAAHYAMQSERPGARHTEQSESLRIRIQCRLFSQGGRNAARRAVFPFFLWYVGDREEAIAEAGAVARANPDTVFAQWPARMASASE